MGHPNGNTDSRSLPHTKSQSALILDITDKIVTLLEENVEENLTGLGMSKYSSNKTQK